MPHGSIWNILHRMDTKLIISLFVYVFHVTYAATRHDLGYFLVQIFSYLGRAWETSSSAPRTPCQTRLAPGIPDPETPEKKPGV
jgi:hypothetical protein